MCREHFTDKNNALKHLRVAHDVGEAARCEFCSATIFVFTDYSDYNKHVSNCAAKRTAAATGETSSPPLRLSDYERLTSREREHMLSKNSSSISTPLPGGDVEVKQEPTSDVDCDVTRM